MCPDVVARELIATPSCPEDTTCNEATPWYGITSSSPSPLTEDDYKFAAAFLAAAADKAGTISVDMVVYINSILGINKVIGYSAYDDEGNPTSDSVNYAVNPVYFDFNSTIGDYNRDETMDARGEGGEVTVLQGGNGVWAETDVVIKTAIPFRNLMFNSEYLPDGTIAKNNILGFTQRADDNLGVIDFIHTYQIPSLR